MVDAVKRDYPVSERRACQILLIHRATYRYQPVSRTSGDVVCQVINKTQQFDYWGYRKITDLVQREGVLVGREKVRQIRSREGLQVPPKPRKRRRTGSSNRDVSEARYPGHVWCYDFLFDRTEDGKTLKFLTLVDEYSRVGLAASCGRSMTGRDVIRTLEQLISQWGSPDCLRSDNGSEFVAHQVR